jgi:hypothetical protein
LYGGYVTIDLHVSAKPVLLAWIELTEVVFVGDGKALDFVIRSK